MMKSIVKGITTLGLFSVCVLYGYSLNAQNLVSNGGLENWTDGDPDGWSHVEDASEETIILYEGSSSVKHDAGTNDLGQVISVTGGEEYSISYYFLDDDVNARSRIYSYWRTDGSTLDDDEASLRPNDFSSDSSEWQEVSLTLTAPAAANELYLEVRTYNDNAGGGSIYYDNFSVTPPVPSIQFTNLDEGDEILLGDYGFEFDLTNYELSGGSTPFPEFIRLYIDDVEVASTTTVSTLTVDLNDPGAHTAHLELYNLATGTPGEPTIESAPVNFTVIESLPATLAVTGLTEGETNTTGTISFGFDVENFTVAAVAAGDGYIVYNFDGGTDVDVFNADATIDNSDLDEGDHTLNVMLVDNAGNALDPAVEETINFTIDLPVPMQNLFFSEYVEGSGVNKALEIYNPSDVTVDLSDYRIEVASNGGGWANSFPLSGELQAGAVVTVYNSGAAGISSVPGYSISTNNSVVNFNGNDARALVHVGPGETLTFLDQILIEDSNDYDDVAGVSEATENKTLVRKPTIHEGNADWDASRGTNTDDSEWIVNDQDDFSDLGSHSVSEPVEEISISFVDPTDGAELSPGEITFEFEVNNYDFGGPTPFPVVVELHIDGEFVANTGTGNTISATVEEGGAHTATLVLTNLVTGDFIPSVEETINFTIIEDPSISFVSPEEGAEVYAGEIDFEFLVSNFDFGGDVPSTDVVELYIDGNLEATVGNGTTISATVEELGAHTATLVLTNLVTGNFDPSIEAVLNFEVIALPELTVVAPTEGAELTPGTIDFEYALANYTLSGDDLVELYIDEVFVGSSSDETTISADVTEVGPHTAVFVLTNSTTGDFDPEVSATVNFSITESFATQDLTFAAGWSIFSVNVQPTDGNISSVMAPVVDNVFIVKDQAGSVYWPEFSVNSINDIDTRYGYQIKVSEETELAVSGTPVDPTTEIPVNEGWSIIGYLPTTALTTGEALASLTDQVVIMKDENGNVFWPLFGIDNIGTMNPGEGYQIKMFSDQTLVYPAEGTLPPRVAAQAEAVHFNKTNNTGRNMTIGLPSTAWTNAPEYGDEIAVLDAANNVVGLAVYQGANTAITVWGTDEVTEGKDGLLEGEQIRLKYWNKAENKEWEMDVVWSQGEAYYTSDAINVVESIQLREAATEGIQLLANVPNPFTGETSLRFHTATKEAVQIQVYNALGTLVLDEKMQLNAAGYQEFVVNANGWNNGTYFYQLSNSTFTATGKMSLIK